MTKHVQSYCLPVLDTIGVPRIDNLGHRQLGTNASYTIMLRLGGEERLRGLAMRTYRVSPARGALQPGTPVRDDLQIPLERAVQGVCLKPPEAHAGQRALQSARIRTFHHEHSKRTVESRALILQRKFHGVCFRIHIIHRAGCHS
eukprot:6188728-Pleurochrysis_carterae.AAC.2